MNNYKIKVNNEAESKEAQELFFELGYDWFFGNLEFSNCSSKLITANSDGLLAAIEDDRFSYQELTPPQLRDLVVLHCKDVGDATHTDGERKGFLSSDGVEYFWNAYDLEWFKAKQMTFAYEKFKPIQEQGLISGADALRALADGLEVEFFSNADFTWKDIFKYHPNLETMSNQEIDINNKFRLKPRTMKLELEIPAPFEPKYGDNCYRLAPILACGYTEFYFDGDSEDQFGAWRTEEEIKQVVAALRGGIKG